MMFSRSTHEWFREKDFAWWEVSLCLSVKRMGGPRSCLYAPPFVHKGEWTKGAWQMLCTAQLAPNKTQAPSATKRERFKHVFLHPFEELGLQAALDDFQSTSGHLGNSDGMRARGLGRAVWDPTCLKSPHRLWALLICRSPKEKWALPTSLCKWADTIHFQLWETN